MGVGEGKIQGVRGVWALGRGRGKRGKGEKDWVKVKLEAANRREDRGRGLKD